MFGLVASWALASAARAADIYWDGLIGSTGWDSTNSWSTNSIFIMHPGSPPGSSDTAIFNQSTVNTAQTVNLNAAQAAAALVFGSSGTVLIQTGSGTNTLALGTGGITVNAGAGDDTISSALSLSGAQSWLNNSASTLTVSGNITNGSNLLTVDGTGNTVISGVLGNGSGGLTKLAGGTLSLTGSSANTYTGMTTVDAGTLNLDKL
jgi:autotransporter-associated beta strand protein